MRVRAAVSYEAQSHTCGVVHTSNRAAVDTIYGLRVRHADKHDAAQQHGSHQQACAEPPLARVRTPPVEDLNIFSAGRAAPGVLAVVARPVHLRRARASARAPDCTVTAAHSALRGWELRCVPRLA